MPHRLDITNRLHKRLLEIVGTALPLIPGSLNDADIVGLSFLRGEMVEAIEAYCRHVHQLRDDAIRQGDAAAMASAETLVHGCTNLRTSYDAFRNRWAHRQAAESWHEYRLSAIVMMKQVRDHVLRGEARRTTRLPLAA